MRANYLLGLSLLACGSASAGFLTTVSSCPDGNTQLTASGFSTTWDTCGTANGVDSVLNLDSTNAATDASAGALESWLGLPRGTLFLAGSAAAQTVSFANPTQISFNWEVTIEGGAGAILFYALNGIFNELDSNEGPHGIPARHRSSRRPAPTHSESAWWDRDCWTRTR